MYPLKLLVCALSLGMMLTSSADAANKNKKPKPVASSATVPCRGGNLFRCGPVYNGNDYLGNDPDPYIRMMIQRDLGAKYGGET